MLAIWMAGKTSGVNYEHECWQRGTLSGQLKPTQRRAYDWWQSNDATLSVLHARRGFGKTWLFLTIAFEYMAKNPGSRLVYAAPSREQAKQIVIPTANLLIPADLPDAYKPRWVATEHAFLHPNGSRCVVDGADDERGDHLRGPFAHIVFMDEQAFWRYCARVTTSVLYPQVQRTGGRMFSASTSPESTHHEFTQLIDEAKREGAYMRVALDDDETVPQFEKDRIAAQYSNLRDPVHGRESTAYRREFGCEIVTETEAAVFPEFEFIRHVGERAKPEFWDGYVSLDLGMQDFSHGLAAFYDFDSATVVVEDEVCMQSSPVSTLAPAIVDLERRVFGNVPPRSRVSDNHPMEIAEFGKQHLLQPDKVPRELVFSAAGNRNPEALINRARGMLEADRILIHPRCRELIKQCQGGLWNQNRTDFRRIIGLGHLDGLMSLVYMLDIIDYAHNPNMRKRLDPATHAIYYQKTEDQRRYGQLSRLLPASARGKHG